MPQTPTTQTPMAHPFTLNAPQPTMLSPTRPERAEAASTGQRLVY